MIGTAHRVGATVVGVGLLLALPVQGQDPNSPALAIELVEPEILTVGDRQTVIARVQNPQQPLLLTPRVEGDAVEVVRGRLLRRDATDGTADVLEFPIPIVAREAGVSVLRVRVQTFVCDSGCEGDECSCTPVSREASVSLRVREAR